MQTDLTLESIAGLLTGRCSKPRSFLGVHRLEPLGERRFRYVNAGNQPGGDTSLPCLAVIRAWLPGCVQATAVDRLGNILAPLRLIHPAGLFEGVCPHLSLQFQEVPSLEVPYLLRMTDTKGNTMTTPDPYCFTSFLSDLDIYLLGEGRHWQSYDKLGAHVRTINGVSGVNFVVWAPNAVGVSVVGDFNSWDRYAHPMHKIGYTGYWEMFIPGVKEGDLYKYAVNQQGTFVDKFDPYAFGSECPPHNASKVVDLSVYQWTDGDWVARRAKFDWQHAPMSVYEVHFGSFKRPDTVASDDVAGQWLSYRQMADELIPYVKKLGFTHIELLPLAEHPLSASWGYQIVGYFCPTARYGSAEDLMYFIDQCHLNGIGVIMDWVPAHFPKDLYGLARFDGTALYEHADPRKGEHRDWGTYIFNFSRYEVRNFLIANALYWIDKFHIDGLRVDAVASMLYLDYSRNEGDWVPNQYGGRENLEAVDFLRLMNQMVGENWPGVLTIAEESTAWPKVTAPPYEGGLGFSLKWNMGWMNDTLTYINKDPLYRQYHHNSLTFSLIYAFSENFVLPLSHDEVVHGKGSLISKMPGDPWQKYANLRLLFSYMWTHPGKKLLFMGGELGQWSEWNFDSQLNWELLDSPYVQGLMKMIGDLNDLYVHSSALHEQEFTGSGFNWIDCSNYQMSTLSYLRKGCAPGDYLVCAANFTPCIREDFWVGVPQTGVYETVFNSDMDCYSGSGVYEPTVEAEAVNCQGQPATIRIKLPPLGFVIFRRRKGPIEEILKSAHEELPTAAESESNKPEIDKPRIAELPDRRSFEEEIPVRPQTSCQVNRDKLPLTDNESKPDPVLGGKG